MSIDGEFREQVLEIYADAPPAGKILEYAASLAAALLLLGCVLGICILLRGQSDDPKQAYRALGPSTGAEATIVSAFIDRRP